MKIRRTYEHEPAQCLVGLHAAKSAAGILAFRAQNADKRIILVLTGTDLYRDIRTSAAARRALEAADVLVTLQPAGLAELPKALRGKAVAIVQSAAPVARRKPALGEPFTICVLGHLRKEKDPMRAAYAVRTLPRALDVRVIQAGQILDERFRAATQRETRINPRYLFLGELNRNQARKLLAQCNVLVQSSRMEGGANTICEAIASGIPIIASRISGNVGILGRSYPGLYPVGNTHALAALLQRAATSRSYNAKLQTAINALKPLVRQAHERRLWKALIV